MNTTPCPTNTALRISTRSQTNVWLLDLGEGRDLATETDVRVAYLAPAARVRAYVQRTTVGGALSLRPRGAKGTILSRSVEHPWRPKTNDALGPDRCPSGAAGHRNVMVRGWSRHGSQS